jgi:hydroxymethylglutaryl-CoA lyase
MFLLNRDIRLPSQVSIVEVGLRDGLQIEKQILPTTTKLELISRLAKAGIRYFEVTSFVNPQKVPQLADAEEVFHRLENAPSLTYTALVPNEKGYERARSCGVKHIRLVVMATETFNKRNFNRFIEEALEECVRVIERSFRDGIKVSGVIGAAFGCPYEGTVSAEHVLKLTGRFLEYGAKQIIFADTTGVATPLQVYSLLSQAQDRWPEVGWGCHFHNTRNTGLTNVVAAIQAGVKLFDSAIGGMGGCPFAPHDGGNVATEDLVHMLHEMGIHTGVDVAKTIEVALWLETVLERSLPGQVMKTAGRSTSSTTVSNQAVNPTQMKKEQ